MFQNKCIKSLFNINSFSDIKSWAKQLCLWSKSEIRDILTRYLSVKKNKPSWLQHPTTLHVKQSDRHPSVWKELHILKHSTPLFIYFFFLINHLKTGIFTQITSSTFSSSKTFNCGKRAETGIWKEANTFSLEENQETKVIWIHNSSENQSSIRIHPPPQHGGESNIYFPVKGEISAILQLLMAPLCSPAGFCRHLAVWWTCREDFNVFNEYGCCFQHHGDKEGAK